MPATHRKMKRLLEKCCLPGYDPNMLTNAHTFQTVILSLVQKVTFIFHFNKGLVIRAPGVPVLFGFPSTKWDGTDAGHYEKVKIYRPKCLTVAVTRRTRQGPYA